MQIFLMINIWNEWLIFHKLMIFGRVPNIKSEPPSTPPQELGNACQQN